MSLIKRIHKTILYLAYLTCVLVCGLILSELIVRKIWDGKYANWLESSVNTFGYIDRELLVERYKPGYKRSVEEILSDLENSGKKLRYRQTKSYIEKYGLTPHSLAFQINRFGFKGPEIPLKPLDGVIRIMTIGDSCTFGPHIDRLSYPRQLEKLLNEGQPGKFEVVNAGHLGYNFQQVLSILDEWLMLEPDIITIYLGWNRTILRADPKKNDKLYYRFAIYRCYYHAMVNRTNTKGVESLFTGRFDLSDPWLKKLKKRTFEVDLNCLKKIVKKIRDKSPNTKIALIALAGLYTTQSQPTSIDIRKGYATAFNPNLAVWAILSEQFNNKLRKFAIDQNLILFDLEKFANVAFRPRTQFFVDSVHPSPLGYFKIAEFLSESIKTELLK